jgi:hypothetical protein
MSKKITCTRCLGKGYVDNKDLKRLKRKSVWDENSECKFCKGKGTITENFASKHNPNSEKFSNVNDNSGLITNKEMNEQYREFKEKVSDNKLEHDNPEQLKYAKRSTRWFLFIIFFIIGSLIIYYFAPFAPTGKDQSEILAYNITSFLFLIIFCIWVTAEIVGFTFDKD